LAAVLQMLDASGCPYALIQRDLGLDAALTSDVDIAFGVDPNEVVTPIVRRVTAGTGAQLVQCLHYEIPRGYYYVISVGTPPRFLHLDCLFDPRGINRYRLPTPFLVEHAIRGRFARRACDARLALYLLMKRAVKGDASKQALRDLRDAFSGARDAAVSDVRNWFGDEAPGLLTRLLEAHDPLEVSSLLRRLRSLAERRFKSRRPGRWVQSLVWDAWRKLRRFVKPTGFLVVLLGPDGAGKSSVAGLVELQLTRAFRRTWRFHWRPGVLPKLRRRETTDGPQAQAAPPEHSKYHGIVSFVRFAYYWLDFVVGYWVRVYPRRARTTLIVGERYFPDVLVNPARYGFAVPRWLLRVAARCVPSPDLLVLLTADPTLIHRRKPELSICAIAEQLVSYTGEIAHWPAAVAVDATGEMEGVAARVSGLVLDACARRTALRLPRERPRWRAFPSSAHARVWVADDDTVANALRLYHPYSLSGRIMKRSSGLIPRRLFMARACAPDAETSARFDRIALRIRQQLAVPDVGVSFAFRTDDPRRRLTAQASLDGAPVGYVKVASNDVDAAALRREAEMIDWMRPRLTGVAVLPDVLGFQVDGLNSLLFLTAPNSPGTQRALLVDRSDTRFLSALLESTRDRQPVKQMLEAIGARLLLERLVQDGEQAAETVRAAMGAVERSFCDGSIRTAPAHGDYAPWNALGLPDGALYVFDWEHSRKDAPLFTDVFHRVAMPARLVCGQTPDKVVHLLWALCDDPVLGPVIERTGVPPDQLGAYVLVYLLGLAVREHVEHGAVSDFMTHALQLAHRRLDGAGRRAKVLVAAYACEPGGGSEPGVGWNVCQAISREHEAWVVTRRNNREVIEAELARQPNENLHFHYADLPRWMSFWKKRGRGIRTYYYLWQFAAALEARRLMGHVRFDVAHHVTFVNSYIFSFLGLLPLPFVWGPLGNNPILPVALAPAARAVLRDRLRDGWQRILRVIDPLFWLCVYRARVIVGINPSIARRQPFALLASSKCVVHPAIGVEGRLIRPRDASASKGDSIRILSVGQMIAIKGFHLALRAHAQLLRTGSKATLEIVGDGPEMARLRDLASELGVVDSVTFTGWLSRPEALSRYASADIFLFPSCEGAGMVVLEAMAHGLPTVCLAYGGPGEMVTADCGVAVRVTDLAGTVMALAAALAMLANDPSLRDKMGAAARIRVAERYSWDLRHRFIGQWYEAALSQRSCPREARAA
jgi:glycosyltransferase involved in cell wall biosynthesis